MNKKGICVIRPMVLWGHDQSKTYTRFSTQLMEAQDEGLLDVLNTVDIIYGVHDNNLFLTDGTHTFSTADEELPAWCLVRTADVGLLRHIENMGIKCYPSSYFVDVSKRKGVTHSIVAKSKVKQPNAWFGSPQGKMPEGKFGFDAPYIVKAQDSNSGDKVFRMFDSAGVRFAERACEFDCIKQEALQNTSDVRVYILCGKILLALLRSSTNSKEFRANVHTGGESHLYELTEKQRQTVYQTLEAFDWNLKETGFITLDYLFENGSNENLMFLEMNTVPGINGLLQDEYDKSDTFVKYYISQIQEQFN